MRESWISGSELERRFAEMSPRVVRASLDCLSKVWALLPEISSTDQGAEYRVSFIALGRAIRTLEPGEVA